MKIKLCILSLILLFSLACGGGGGGATTTTTGGSTQSAVDVSPPTASSSSARQLLFQLANNVILPAYRELVNSFGMLDTSVGTFCSTPNAQTLAGAQAAWRTATDSWMKISLIEFGPVGRDNGELRIFFFPDDNDNVGRSVARVLAGSDALDSASIVNQSVAAQGLPALEVILFSTDPVSEVTAETRRCQLARAITGNILNIANATAFEWDPNGAAYVNELAGAGQGSQRFPTEQLAIEELVNELAGIASLIRLQKLSSPLGAGTASAQPTLFESPISQTSKQNIAMNIVGARQLYLGGSGFGFDDLLIAQGNADLDAAIQAQLNAVETRANALSTSLVQASQGSNRNEALALAQSASDLSRIFSGDLASATGSTISFNENDGD